MNNLTPSKVLPLDESLQKLEDLVSRHGILIKETLAGKSD